MFPLGAVAGGRGGESPGNFGHFLRNESTSRSSVDKFMRIKHESATRNITS